MMSMIRRSRMKALIVFDVSRKLNSQMSEYYRRIGDQKTQIVSQVVQKMMNQPGMKIA
jgi:hypothetical protein